MSPMDDDWERAAAEMTGSHGCQPAGVRGRGGMNGIWSGPSGEMQGTTAFLSAV